MTDAPIQVLLVEDNLADAVLLREALAASKRDQFVLTHAKRLEEALDRLDSERFDVILLDLGLPDSQGLPTLARTRRQAREMPVVVLTGLHDEAMAIQAAQEGAQDYLIKGETTGSTMMRAIRYAIERKRAEEAIHAREAELAHLSRVTTMGQMASGLAHELNQPLAAILNYASVCLAQVESDKVSPPVMLTALRELMNETRRAGSIISRLRSFVRKQKPKSVSADINGLVDESLRILDFELRHQGFRPRLQLAEKLPLVSVDVVQIEQVLVNLIFNALEAMEEDKSPQKQLVVQTACCDDRGQIEVSVIDRGPGVSAENMGRLFDPFFTTKSKGLGMGLNISRSIVESHGGRLTAAANPEGGMRFCFTLPVAEGAER